jgi:hypothetical protein
VAAFETFDPTALTYSPSVSASWADAAAQ